MKTKILLFLTVLFVSVSISPANAQFQLVEEAVAQAVDAGAGGQKRVDDKVLRWGVCRLYASVEGGMGGLFATIAGVIAVIFAVVGAFKAAWGFMLVSVGAFILRSLVSLFYGGDFDQCGAQVRTFFTKEIAQKYPDALSFGQGGGSSGGFPSAPPDDQLGNFFGSETPDDNRIFDPENDPRDREIQEFEEFYQREFGKPSGGVIDGENFLGDQFPDAPNPIPAAPALPENIAPAVSSSGTGQGFFGTEASAGFAGDGSIFGGGSANADASLGNSLGSGTSGNSNGGFFGNPNEDPFR